MKNELIKDIIFKAILIASGFSQESMNYNVVFYLFMRHTPISIFIAIVIYFNIELERWI